MLQDLRYALRLLRRAPGFTSVATLTLAIGIGTNAAMFSVVRGALLAPPPFPDANRLMVVWEGYPPAMPKAAVSVPGFADIRAARDIFEDAAAFSMTNANLTGGGEPERVVVARVTHSFQPVLGVRVAIGRWFDEDEDRPNQNAVVVLSDGLWRRRFGGDVSIVGGTIDINDRACRVIGVMAADGTFPKSTDLWMPIAFTPQQRTVESRGSQFLDAIARLRPGVSDAQARSALTTLSSRLRAEYYADTPRWTLGMRPLAEDLVGSARAVLLTAFGAVGFVLLIACANVANLLLARAGSRRRELAVRAAVGAPPGRLRRQLLVETSLLGALGAAAGAAVAAAVLPVLAAAVARSFPRVGEPRLDPAVFLFALAIAVASTLAFGLLPVWQLSRADLRTSLAESQRGATGGRARRVFVVAEVALAFALLIGAGLLVRSFARVMSIEPGFGTDGRLTLRVSLPAARYRAAPQRAAFYATLLERLSTLPGVRRAAAVSELPLGEMRNMGTFEIEGQPASAADLPHGNWRSVSERYFEAMAIPLVRGRTFADRDGLDAPRVAMVDELAAARYWPGRDPIGSRVTIDGQTWLTIVGVVRSVHHDSLEDDMRPTLYFALAQRPTATAFAVVQTDAEPLAMASAVRAAVRNIDPLLPVYDVRTLDARLIDSLGQRRTATWLIGVFGLIAMLLAAIGVYGVIAYDVGERAQEIAVRMALGATRVRVVALVVGSGVRLASIGVAVGAMLAIGLARTAGALIVGVSPYDPSTYVALAAAVLAIVVGACYVPARRAASQDALVALRTH